MLSLQPRSYRCTYTPLDRDGFPVLSEPGLLPHIQVQARSAEDAQRKAWATLGSPIVMVERLEGVA